MTDGIAEGLRRPKPLRGRDTVTMSMRIPRGMAQRVKAAADLQGVTASEWLENLIDTQLLRKR